MENVFIMDHPLIQHKISILRKKETGTNEFRRLIEEIAMLMGYEALRDLPLEDVKVETPIETCMTPMVSGTKMAIVPVLRAGLGMVNGITALVPSAKIGHIGLYRDPVQSRIGYKSDIFPFFQPLCNHLCRLINPFHTKREGNRSPENLPCIKWTDHRTDIYLCLIPDTIHGFYIVGYNCPTLCIPMSVNIFCYSFNDKICTQFQWFLIKWRSKGIVHR